MNINKPKTRSKVILCVIAVAVVLAAIATYFAYASKTGPFAHLNTASSREAANSSDETNPQQKENTPSLDKQKEAGTTKTTDDIPVADTGTLDITSLSQDDNNISYAAFLKNIDTPGTCSALFEHTEGAARPVTRTYSSTGSECPETKVPSVEFAALGEWKLTLRYYVNETQLIDTKTFEVK